MKTAKDYFKRRQAERYFNEKHIGVKRISDIMNKEDIKECLKYQQDALLGMTIYELKDIKEKYCLSWSELREICCSSKLI